MLGVLIETLWNVKELLFIEDSEDIFSINRNIVECKVLNDVVKQATGVGINRNIVECKEIFMLIGSWICLCINRNIVECKVFWR